jgi:NAD(P)-dependent dehydrogenase (short-subunit alcohol dehydrogenase family)
MELERKVALVTGGTRGIGAATACLLAARGAELAIVGRYDDQEARATQAQVEERGRSCLLITADMGLPEDCRRAVRQTIERYGTVDILVHCAGGLVSGGLLETTPEAWHRAFDVHVHAIFYLCREAIPEMMKKREGAVILVSSVAGLRGLPMHLPYQVVKGALPQFARALAREFAEYNIRVNCIAPGIIRTRFHAGMTPEQYRHNIENRIPLHREGTPEQVAELILQLITNDYITGETMVIDGGLTMRIA